MSLSVEIYRALAIASALRLYARTGLKANRAYTPANMLRTAATILGRTRPLPARDYLGAADLLTAHAHELAARLDGGL